MNTNLTIKNFRVFDEEGVTIELKPLTILTGCNSSGKSSVVKAVLLLNDFLSQIKKAIDNDEQVILENYKIDFSKYPNNLLGKFDKVVHNGSSNKEVTIAYTTYSRMLSKEVDVEFVFAADINDELNNAHFERLTLKTEDGVFYTSSRQKGTHFNLYQLKDACIEFLSIEHCIYEYCRMAEDASTFPHQISEKEIEEIENNILKFNKSNNKFTDVAEYVRYALTADRRESIITKCKTSSKIVKWSQKNGSLFKIPLLDLLDKESKEDLKNINTPTSIDDFNDKLFWVFSKKIITDYINSNFEKFSDYFKNKEEIYLKNVNGSYFRPKSITSFINYHIYNYDNPTKNEIEDWCNQPIDFEELYLIVMFLNENYKPTNNLFYDYDFPGSYVHDMYNLLRNYATNLIKEVITPEWSGMVEYVSSSRIKVNRQYSLYVEDDFTKLLKRYFDNKRNIKGQRHRLYNVNGGGWSYHSDYKPHEPHDFIKKWLKNFELGEDISLSMDDEGLGVQIRLQKNKEEKKGELLADEGYGITQLVSILLQIETTILSAKGIRFNPCTQFSNTDYDKRLGYQVSFIDATYDMFQYEPQIIAIEEPEIHLHPKYQSLLAEMFLEAYQKYNIHFIIETHSEYLVRKTQVLVANENYKNEKELKDNNPFVVYYVNPKNEKAPCYQMVYRTDGCFANDFGEGFFDEAEKLAFEIL